MLNEICEKIGIAAQDTEFLEKTANVIMKNEDTRSMICQVMDSFFAVTRMNFSDT